MSSRRMRSLKWPGKTGPNGETRTRTGDITTFGLEVNGKEHGLTLGADGDRLR